jgi:hypothetical protein
MTNKTKENEFKRLQRIVYKWQSTNLSDLLFKRAQLYNNFWIPWEETALIIYRAYVYRLDKLCEIKDHKKKYKLSDVIPAEQACNMIEYNLPTVVPHRERGRYLNEIAAYLFKRAGRHKHQYHILNLIRTNKQLSKIPANKIFYLKKDLQRFNKQRDKAKAERLKVIEELGKVNEPAQEPNNPHLSDPIMTLGGFIEFRTSDINLYGPTHRDLNNYFAKDKVVETREDYKTYKENMHKPGYNPLPKDYFEDPSLSKLIKNGGWPSEGNK